jgi:hypothetical protein
MSISRRGAVVAAVTLIAGCATSSPSPSPVLPDVVERRSTESSDGIELSLEVASTSVGVGEEIVAFATLTNLAATDVTVFSSGSGPVAFSVGRLEDGLAVDAGWTLDCAPHKLPSGEPARIAFAKSGGWDPQGPNVAFYEAYFAEPALRLPAGTWQITAQLHGSIGDCGGRPVELATSVTVSVSEQ